MIKFVDPVLESICEALLTPEENKLKIVNGHILCANREIIDMYKSEKEELLKKIASIDKVIAISEVVMQFENKEMIEVQ